MASQYQVPYTRAGKLHFYCPLCQHHQTTSTIQRMSWKHHGQLVILTLAFTLVALPVFGWCGLLFHPFFWAAFDFAYRLRKRQALVCESCGFDPFLYKRDVLVARRALRQHWEKKIANERLFAGKKLKNYQTATLNQEQEVVSNTATNAADLDEKSAGAPANTP